VAQLSRYSPEVRRRAVWMAFWCERPVGPVEQRPYGRVVYTPYWTTFELPAVEMKAASVGTLDQIAAGLRQWSPRKTRAAQSPPSRSAYFCSRAALTALLTL